MDVRQQREDHVQALKRKRRRQRGYTARLRRRARRSSDRRPRAA